MEKLKLGLVLLGVIGLSFTSFSSAGNVTSQTHATLYEGSNCDGGTFDRVMYAGSKGHEMIDTFTDVNTTYVWQILGESRYSVHNEIPNAMTVPTLEYYSNGKPNNVSTVVVMGTEQGASITSNIPSDYKRSQIAGQIVYHVVRQNWIYSPGTYNSGQYLDYNNPKAGTQKFTYDVSFANITKTEKFSDNECMNIHIGFCGDGILDNNTSASSYETDLNARLNGGEECDPNDPNQEGWKNNGKKCSSSCKLEDLPKPKCGEISTEYNSSFPTARVTTSTPGICKAGTLKSGSFSGPDNSGEYKWKCELNGFTTDYCTAQDLFCGDGERNGSEACDGTDGAGTYGCSAACTQNDKPKVKPECGTIAKEYNSSFPTARITTSTSGLCKVGTLKSGSLKGPNNTTIGKGKYEWYCENDGYETEACTTSDEYCGDGDKNGDEACDGTDGAGTYGCSAACTQNDKPKVKPECGTIAKEYNSSFPTARITTSTSGLCKVGTLKSGSLKGPNNTTIGKGKYEWYCENDGYETEACTTSDEYCGDGDKNGDEACDGTDGAGTYGCSATCTQNDKPKVKPECGTIAKEYNSSFPTARIKTSTSGLCKVGTLKSGSLKGPNDTTIGKGKYEWYCENDGYETEACTTSDEYCGDGDKNGDEACDGTDGAGIYGCSATCTQNDKPKVKPECGTIAKEYNSSFPTARIKTSTSGLCKVGTLKSGSLKGPNDTTIGKGKYEWYCENDGYETEACTTSDEYCGDGDKNGDEACDGTDGAGIYGCSATCTQNTEVVVKMKEKALLDNRSYSVGDKIGFKVTFENNTDSTIYNVVVKDIFPRSLILEDAKIYGVSSANLLKYKDDEYKNQIIEFNGFNLDPGKSGYFIVTGEVTEDNLSDLINYACAYKNDGKADNCVTKIFDIERKLNVEKSANVGNVLNGDSVEYSVKITSFGGDYSKLIVKDKLPSGVSYIKNSGKVGGVLNNPKLENGYLIWTLDVGSFKKGEEIIITYSVKVADYSTETSYTNKVCVIDSYDVELGCHGITVPKGTGSMSISKYISKYYNSDWGNSLELSASDNDIVVYFKILVQGEKGKLKTFKIEDEYDTGVFELLKQADGIDNYYISGFNKDLNGLSKIDLDNGKITWEVIMKDDGKFSEGDEFYVIFPMKLKSMEGGNVACIVDPLSDPKICSNKVTFTVESDPEPKPPIPEPECGNGIQDVNEYCDLGIGGGFVENGVLFKNGGKKNYDYNGWKCTDKCELISTGNFTPSCFNVQNGSISIMEGELLPFYWNMEGMLGSHSKTERENFLKDHFYSSQAGGECNFDNVYKVDLDSMICEFIVYGPSTGQNVIYRITDVGCVGINGRGSGANNTEYYPAIKKYIEQNWDGWFDGSVTMDSKGGVYKMKNVFQTLDNGWLDNNYPTLYPYSSKLIIKDFGANEPYVYGLDKKITRVNNINAFGEFKVALNSVSYDYCNYTKSDKGKIIYEMSHNKNKSRVCEVDFAVTNHYLTQESPYGAVDKKTVNGLKSYYLKNGNPLFSLEDIDKKVDDYYQIMAGIADDFDAFIKKYSRIARGNGELRQVAGSLIFVTDKSPGVGAFEIPASMLTSGKPFTLLASQGANIRIPGNIKQNIMVITTGSIIFDATNACNGAEHQKAGQVVKGIFYAGNNYHTVGDKYNTSVDNERWCNYGNLHIKGTVLGDLSSVRDNRRSELYTWFHDGCNSKSSTKCSSKRNVVIRGASVMVEFNSELFGELPPGADEFNRILQLKRN